MARALQDEEDTEAIATEWISFFQQPAESEIPDLCIDAREHEWRSSGSGTPSGKESAGEGVCECIGMCICRRRHGGRRTHSRRSSLQASWKRARQELRDSEGDEYWRG
eukprot:3144267-Heterocapsa_arctica.AAC.1